MFIILQSSVEGCYYYALIQLFRSFCFLNLLLFNFSAVAQLNFTGKVIDADSGEPLKFVNIGIIEKNIGTVSFSNGSFSVLIPDENLNDTLTFSLVGYYRHSILIKSITSQQPVQISLNKKSMELNAVEIKSERLVEKKYGIKKRGAIMHFTDGMFLGGDVDIFEIAQLIKLGETHAQILSAHLFINDSRKDSVTFRINFYKYDGEKPKERILENSIIQRHTLEKGWLKLDLEKYQIQLKEDFIIALEFLPEEHKQLKPISYEVKLGGSTKSFYRRNSLGNWNRPPHHYCMYITALVNESTPDEISEDEESLPAFRLYSENVNDTFSLFVHLPKDYNKKDKKRYPVIYHLDGNAYFDQISQYTYKRKKTSSIVVGIGYKNVYLMDSLRVRDYTIPQAFPADSFPVSGGGEKFYHFIQEELIPKIDEKYRTIPENRSMAGHSFGGYFTLYTLLKNLMGDKVFKNFIAASPSLSYHDYYIVQQFKSLLDNKEIEEENLMNVYFTMGELELEKDDKIFSNFIELLSNIKSIHLKSDFLKNTEHMGTAIPSFENGIKFISKQN